ncbi:MAG TPA: (5-formylfuran-3-yl)methyl phosphate synthase [Caulifigura sp.]|nr:(5-formylfuran-3-yl)methyl phosphate synthase [Caulifigura sp.]
MTTLPLSLRSKDPGVPPILLVSVRSVLEAEEAIAGGADILDLKDPERGSLGCADRELMRLISPAGLPVTAALGECMEWAGREAFELPGQLAAVKLGLAGLGGRADWKAEWVEVRRRFEASSARRLEWVAVAYVDSDSARAPSITDVATAAVETGCRGLLLDTCDKGSGRLFDSVTERELAELAERVHAAGLFLAAAGRLTTADIARLAGLPVDIVAVRSAACAGNDRRSGVRGDRVAACRQALTATPGRLSGAY